MRLRPLASLVVFFLAAASAPLALAAAAPVTTQLPRGVQPLHYDVRIVPHAARLSFEGQVDITIEVREPTRRLTLNALDLKIRSARLAPVEAPAQTPPAARKATRITTDAAAQTASFGFASPIAPGRYRLSIDYTGRIGRQANGLFAIDYDTAAGRQRALYTQFENSDARRFIPSWDEPAYKATFALTATVPRGQMAVSNMPAASITPLGQSLQRVQFENSPSMSTYLLFFGLGDFERAILREGATEVGVVTRRGAVAQAQFALESSARVLREYNDYFGVPYPLPKLDNIASPGRSQFFGAMENWGAIFTFEHVLLIDPSITTQAEREDVFGTAAHEIAHQWFGDLVTMAWWDDLWLNEGFASWMTARTMQRLHPEWATALGEVGTRSRAMRLDALQTTHPVVQHVDTVGQANQAFDDITYLKGQAVIGMLEAYVGADAWRDGVRRYMKKHAYGSTVSDDLWAEMDAAAGQPVTAIAHDFTLQPGIPLVRVEACTCEGDTTLLQLRQAEFSVDRPDKKPLAWRVPVIARTLGGAEVRALVSSETAGTAMRVPGCRAPVVNAGQSGYYRTLYPAAQQAQLRAEWPAFEPIDQLGLMDDTWALGLAGAAPVTDALELVARTPLEADPQVWGDIAGRLEHVDDLYRADPSRQAAWRRFAVSRLAPMFTRVGWQPKAGEPTPTINLRARLIETLSALGDEATIAEARRRNTQQKSDASLVPAELRQTILGVVARHADAATWDALRLSARAEKTPLVKDRLYAFLSSAEDPALARRALELALSNEPGATNSAAMIAGASRLHPDLAFDFALANRARVARFVDASNAPQFYPGLGASSLSAAMPTKIADYAQRDVPADARRAAESVIAAVRNRIGVAKERLPEVDAWLRSLPRM
jgi:aminopeptidase N